MIYKYLMIGTGIFFCFFVELSTEAKTGNISDVLPSQSCRSSSPDGRKILCRLIEQSLGGCKPPCRSGPTGPTGATGPTGLTGATGPQGAVSQAYGALGLVLGECSAQSYSFTGTGGPISDNSSTIFTIPDVPEITMTSLQVVLSNLTHTFAGDLGAFVTLPNATQVPLFFRIGNFQDYKGNYTFSDNGQRLVTFAIFDPIPSGVYFATSLNALHTPVNINGIVSGQNSGGLWQLTINDFALQDVGNLGSWTIILNCEPITIDLVPTFTLAPLEATGNQFFNTTPNDSTLGINISGDYQISYSAFGKTPIFNANFIEVVVGVNGDTTNNVSLGHFSTVNFANNPVGGSKSVIVHLNAGDSIGLYVRSDQATALYTANFSLNAVLLKADSN